MWQRRKDKIMEYKEKLSELIEKKLQCPHCECALANTYDTHKLLIMSLNYRSVIINNPPEYIIDCQSLYNYYNIPNINFDNQNCIIVEYILCPSCGKISIIVHNPQQNFTIPISPKCIRKTFPDYIPEQIRQDYEEACMIAEISPKASATLSRRCIQGMIRDFWGITQNSLCNEIDEVAKKPAVSELQKNALHALRNIGNIGAHPEREIELMVDVEPDEAKKMISLIEFFMQNWYIKRHDEEEMMKEIINFAKQKK